MRATGFPPKVRVLITQRAQLQCERCGLRPGVEAHHRRPRGAGGTRRESTNQPSNGLWLCGDCHRWVESNRREALSFGLLLRQTEEPRHVQVLYRGALVFLDDLGNIEDVERPDDDPDPPCCPPHRYNKWNPYTWCGCQK